MSSGSGSGYSSGSGSGDDDTVPTYGGGGPSYDAVIKAKIKDNPFALFEDIPCEVLEKWITTARHTVAQAQIDKLSTIVAANATYQPVPGSVIPVIGGNDVAKVQKIDDAYSSIVNLDYFPVTVDELPVIGGVRATPEQFLQHIRKNINNFVDTYYSEFAPYNWYGVDDTHLWNSNNPLGAVVAIDIGGLDNGSVIVSSSSSEKWTFTTIFDPQYGEHPVSGNRDFGYVENNDGSHTFYTRGVDRLTSWDGEFARFMFDDYPFNAADALWTSFQNEVANFVNNHGGNATVDPTEIARPEWADIVDGVKPLSTLNKDCD